MQDSFAVLAPSAKPDVERQAAVNLDIGVAEQALLTGRLMALRMFNSEYLLSLDRSSPGSAGVITYSGNVFDHENNPIGDILLTSGEGMYYSLMRTMDGIYQISPAAETPNAPHVLQKMRPVPARGITDFDDPIAASPHELRHDDVIGEGSSQDTDFTGKPIQQRDVQSSTVELLVLYTSNVRARRGGAGATVNWINTMVADYNNKLGELGTSAKPLLLKAALETSFDNLGTIYQENKTHNGSNACYCTTTCACDSIVADQYWVSTNYMVSNLRSMYGADLVVLITAANQIHPEDFAHGFAGLKKGYTPQTHGSTIDKWGEFATVRDDYALANLTFHHEIGHAFGLEHAHGAATFGYTYTSGAGWEQQSGPNEHKKPITIMEVNREYDICALSSSTSSITCQMRLPYFAHATKSRMFNIPDGWVPRVFDPKYSSYQGQLVGVLQAGTHWVSQRR